jgi:hypothetical protein
MKLLIATLTLLLAGSLQAQTVWRCGADGRSYSDSPCTDGRVVAVADSRSTGEVDTAQGIVEREQTLAKHLAEQRKVREAQLPMMAGIPHTQPEAAVKKPKGSSKQASKQASRRSPATLGTWQATAPASR